MVDKATPDSVAKWTTAIANVDLEAVQQLLSSQGDLLWQPLDKDAFVDFDSVMAQLEQFQLLGKDLDNMSAIPYLLLDHDENVASLKGEEHIMQRKRAELLQFLIKHTSPTDLNTHFWGSCHNTTLHLATFLGHTHMMDQLVQQGASMDINNDLGHSPTTIITAAVKKESKSPRPKKSAERFKQQLDENSSSQDELLRHQTKRQQDIARLAKRSAVKNNPLFKKFEQSSSSSSSSLNIPERQSPRRLNVPEKVDLVRKNSKGISSLKNKSYVTSSVFRQGESSSPSSRSPSPSIPSSPSPEPQQSDINTTSETVKDKEKEEDAATIEKDQSQPSPATEETSKEDEIEQQKESLTGKEPASEQSSQHEDPPKPKEPKDVHSNDDNEKTKQEDTHDTPTLSTADNDDDDDLTPADDNEDDHDEERPDTPTQANLHRAASSDSLKSTASLHDDKSHDNDIQSLQEEQQPITATSNPIMEENVPNDKNMARFSSDSNQLFEASAAASIARDDPRASMRSEMSDQFFDSYEEWVDTPQGRMSLTPPARNDKRQSTSLSSPLRQSIIAMVPTHEEDVEDEDDDSPTHEQQEESRSAAPKTSSDFDETSVASRTPPASFSPQQRRSMGTESIDTLPPLSIKGETTAEEQVPPLPVHENNAVNTRASHQSDYGSIAVQSTSYYVALDKQSEQQQHKEEASQEEQQQQPASETDTIRYTEERVDHGSTQQEEYGNIALRTTSNYVTHRLSQHHHDEDEYKEFTSDYRPPSVKLELPEIKTHPGQSTSAFGKLYIRINCAQDILLPLPKLTSYVRCVVSDGEFEFMSRYELLGQKITFDYECIIDARPDMIITVALHVRPDPHVRPKSGLSKLLTPARKQRETLGGYVHPEDGAIGQTRFALGHMIQACNQKTYQASLDCFNSWYVRSSREQKRQQQSMEEDILKVVGSMSMEMLYLPVTDPTLPIPKNLRECDLALRIRQWHDTCWHSGYLSIRVAGSKLWDRHYCRLIGSQLLGYASKTASSWQPRVQYDIADALRLVASSDQVIVTLVDVPDTRVFQSDTIIEETSRGYFRITFPDMHIDCVCDEPYESEAWVKMLKSMIGRVPLKVPFSL